MINLFNIYEYMFISLSRICRQYWMKQYCLIRLYKIFLVAIPRFHSSTHTTFYQNLSRTSIVNNLYDIRISPTIYTRYSRWRSSFSLYNFFLLGDQLSQSFFGRFFLIKNYAVPTFFTENMSPQCSAQ